MKLKKYSRERAVRCIVAMMCRAGHMSGWCGDTSKEFRDGQIRAFLNLTRAERAKWLQLNESNLRRDCRITGEIINSAL